MAQFVVGFVAGIYIGTHYDCRPGLKVASDTLEQYCPKREHLDHYVPINSNDNDEKVDEAEKKIKDDGIELTSKIKKWF